MDNVKHIWSVLCQRTFIEANSNILSLNEVLEKINVDLKEDTDLNREPPIGIHFRFELVSYWGRLLPNKKTGGEVSIVVYSPSNKVLINPPPIKFEIPEESKSSRTILKFDGLPIVGSGEYKIQVQLKRGKDHEIMAEIPFEVVVNKKKRE